MALLLGGCTVLEAAAPVNEAAGPDWYSLYFSEPQTLAGEFDGGPDEPLAAAIRAARVQVDVAAFELNLARVRDALLSAHRSGVSVRLVIDSDYLDGPDVGALQEAGIEVLGDRREGLMHDKFVIIDRAEVWTGSMNLTVNDAYRNHNNLVRIRSSRLAANYTAEFEEMFVDDRFGPGSPANTPYPALKIEGVRLEVLFSPEDGVEGRIVELIEEAQESIYILAFSFTSDPIAGAILERSGAGVKVSGVFDENQYRANRGAEYETFRLEGLDVRLDGNPRLMHHKVLILDRSIVVAGSYNFTASAEERNDENVLILHSPAIAAQYLEEFGRVYGAAQP